MLVYMHVYTVQWETLARFKFGESGIDHIPNTNGERLIFAKFNAAKVTHYRVLAICGNRFTPVLR